MSISYGQCETVNGAAANAAYNSAYQQAVAEGVSVFVAAGDSGAAGCDNSAAEATHGIGVNAFASTPYNVAVGGTDFSDTFSSTNASIWNSTNTSAFGSALSYIPEIPWNDSCAGSLLSAFLGYSPTYGSTSLCNDPFFGSFFASTVARWRRSQRLRHGHAFRPVALSAELAPDGPSRPGKRCSAIPTTACATLPTFRSSLPTACGATTTSSAGPTAANGGAACGSDPSAWSGAGGTSFASPIMAGIQALINQKAGGPPRQSQPGLLPTRRRRVRFGAAAPPATHQTVPA